jgi:hypothetical protein
MQEGKGALCCWNFKVEDVESMYYEHDDYILNIKCLSYLKRPHSFFILCLR